MKKKRALLAKSLKEVFSQASANEQNQSMLEFMSLMSTARKLTYNVTRGVLFLFVASLGKHVSQN